MDRHRFVIISVAAAITIVALVGMAAAFELTRVPAMHYQIGWIVTLLGCGLMVWKLRANVVVAVLACVGFVVVVRYVAFTAAYALLESGSLWKVFAWGLIAFMLPMLRGAS